MFRVKICGITNVEDALAAADAGADAIGLNFYPASRRYVDAATAFAIIDALPEHVTTVGLFVNASQEQVMAAADTLPLDLVQLHGDETPEFISQLGPRPVMKAFRITADSVGDVERFVAQIDAVGTPLEAVLLDAAVAGKYGGTGQPADWDAARKLGGLLEVPVVLAGGLTAENVAEAIRATRPAGVDVSSGVEGSHTKKDHLQVRRFVANALGALESLRSS